MAKKYLGRDNLYRGMSLVEVIVAIGIFSMIALGVSLFFVRIWPLQRFAMDSAKAQLSASQSITDLVKLIRNMRQSDSGEYALEESRSDEIIFFADEDGDGTVERVRLFLSGTNLQMGVINPSGNPITYPTNQESIRTIATQVRNGSGGYPETLFHYYDDGNEELSGNFSVSDVRMVSIDIYVDVDPSASPIASHFESFASIRNLSEYDHLQ